MKIFRDRVQAGKLLAWKLKKYTQEPNAIILALPRGGVIVAGKIAGALGLPLDIIVTRKIGAPVNPEYAVAAVSLNEIVVFERENPVKEYLDQESLKAREEIERRLKKYRGQKPAPNLENKNIILVDDGLATGLTMGVAIKEIKRQNPKKIVLAVPVAPPEGIEKLKSQVDEIVVLTLEPMFFAVGQFYENFPQISDEEVISILNSFCQDA